MLSAYCIQGRHILYSQGTGRVLNKVLYWGGGGGGGGEGSAERSNPLLLNIPFSTEIVPLSYNFVCLLTAVNSMNIRYN